MPVLADGSPRPLIRIMGLPEDTGEAPGGRRRPHARHLAEGRATRDYVQVTASNGTVVDHVAAPSSGARTSTVTVPAPVSIWRVGNDW